MDALGMGRGAEQAGHAQVPLLVRLLGESLVAGVGVALAVVGRLQVVQGRGGRIGGAELCRRNHQDEQNHRQEAFREHSKGSVSCESS